MHLIQATEGHGMLAANRNASDAKVNAKSGCMVGMGPWLSCSSPVLGPSPLAEVLYCVDERTDETRARCSTVNHCIRTQVVLYVTYVML